MTLIQRVKKVMKNRSDERYRYSYLKYYEKHKMLHKTILVESTHGDSFYGHMYYVVRELSSKFPQYNIFLAASEEKIEEFSVILAQHHMDSVTIVPYLSDHYCELLASAEVLLNDTTFYDFFIKQDFQKYINIWHGTPLKFLGKDTGDVANMGNVQKNFYNADALVVSNNYTRTKMIGSFNLDRVMHGDVVVGPSPRNSILSDLEVRNNVRKTYNLSDKEVLIYMPTWRGGVSDVSSDTSSVLNMLDIIDKTMSDKQVLYVKLHPFQAKLANLDFAKYTHVKAFPVDIESYEFLSGSDALITDYSSIMYDYMNTGKPVVLYTYDKDAYYSSRGCYEDIDDYPFIQFRNLDQLKNWIVDHNSEADYASDFKNEYIGSDSKNGTSQLVSYLMNRYCGLNDDIDLSKINAYCPYNGKETVAIYSGPLWNNGITTALLNTLDNIDLNKRNYVIFFQKSSVKDEFKHILFNLPQEVVFYPIPGKLLGSTPEKFAMRRYMRSEHYKFTPFSLETKKVYNREFKRILGGLQPNYLIHYTGFERGYSEMIASVCDEDVKTAIFVHTDMFKDRKLRGKSLNWKMTSLAYNTADKVVLVSEELRKNFVENFPRVKDKIVVVDNFLGSKKVREKSEESVFTSVINSPVTFADNSQSISSVLEGRGKQINNLAVPPANEFVLNSLAPEYSRIEEFKWIDKSLDLICNDINLKLSKYIMLNEKLQLTRNEVYGLFGISKLRMLDDLLNPEIKVFMNVGRMSAEKGHDRLISSFVKVHEKYPNTRLIIVAPHGNLKNQTISWIKNSGCAESIYLMGSMDNPYSLMRMADALVFTSRYEGLGLVVFEALALDLDVITVNIPGTVAMLQKGNALIAENDDAAITKTWISYMKNGFKKTPFDFRIHDNSSIQQFENIFN